jgi:hypothetical protein
MALGLALMLREVQFACSAKAWEESKNISTSSDFELDARSHICHALLLDIKRPDALNRLFLGPDTIIRLGVCTAYTRSVRCMRGCE